jgi:phosphoglycerate dehydrogenase-like enzyme
VGCDGDHVEGLADVDRRRHVRTASLPGPDVVDQVGELPPDLEIVVWDGTGEAPAGAERIELFVAPYDVGRPPLDGLARLPRLKVVQTLSAGVENWLPNLPDGIELCNGRGLHGASTAELAIAGMLASLRRLHQFEEDRRLRQWRPVITQGLAGRRLLVVGAGDIGQRIGAAAGAFDAEVTFVARSSREGVHGLSDLPRLLPEHDVVAVAVPLVPETRKLVSAEFLAALPDGALVVNVARGAILDTDALLAELQAGRLHAFLDVTDPEPLPVDHPLWDAPNLVLTPHVGGGTRGWERRAYRLIREQLLRFHAGEELANRVLAGY